MSCGHAMIHYKTHCHHAAKHRKLRPCRKERVTGLLQHIDDTCAKCHPPFRIVEINDRHDRFRERKMSQLRKAVTREEAMELQRELEQAHVMRGKELRGASKVRWRGVVLWGPPGAGGEGKEGFPFEF